MVGMKKLFKWTSIVLGGLLGLLIIAAVVLPFFLPLEKIKDFAVEKISETINREVKVEKVSFNIFSGVKLEKLSVSNRQGFAKKPFVSADAIELRYAFWPIFKRQLIIKEIRLVKPEILVEKSSRGTFNYSDLTKKKRKRKEEGSRRKGEQEKRSKQSFSLIVDSFSIRRGLITYADYGTKSRSEIKNANLSISGITLAMLKPIGLNFSAIATYKDKEIPLSLAGKIGLDVNKQIIKIPSLVLNIAGEKAALSANISRWKTGPSVDFSISSKKLSADSFLAIFAAGSDAPKKKTKLKKGELTKKINKATRSIKPSYRVKGKIDIENLTFKNFKLDKINLGLSLANKRATLNIKEIAFYEGKLSGKARVNLAASGLAYNVQNLKLQGFDATPFTNTIVTTFLTRLPDHKDMVDKVYGKLNMNINLRGRGVEPQAIFANAVGNGVFGLTGAEIKRMKILAKLGKTIKSNSLQENMRFKDLKANFSLNKRVLSTKNLRFEDKDIKANFSGGVDLANLVWVPGNRLTLKLSPTASQGVPKELSVFKDKKGWLELTFELTGSLKAPIPKPILDKPIEKALGKLKLKIEAKKLEVEEKAKQVVKEEKKKVEAAAEKKVEETKKQVQEEATEKLKELIKF